MKLLISEAQSDYAHYLWMRAGWKLFPIHAALTSTFPATERSLRCAETFFNFEPKP
jgi:hypothetical protein